MKLAKYSLLVLMVAALAFTACHKGPAKSKWTILAYMDGNNNLDNSQNGSSYCIADVQEMEKVGSTKDVQIMAMVGSLKTGGNCKYYHVEKFDNELPDSLKSTVLENLGTKDMSDKTTLRNFIKAGIEKYPADNYMLIIDDHGGGWRGACEDEQNGAGDLMTMPEIAEALDTFHFDAVVFHACLMSMVEVAYELKGKADYVVASQFTMPMQSILASDDWVAQMVATPTIAPLDICKKIVEAVYNRANVKQKQAHMAVTDLTKLDALAAKVADLGNKLITETGNNWGEVLDAFNTTHYTQYDDPAFVDLREFAKKVLQEPNLQNINLIKNASQAVIDAINDAVPMTMTNISGLTRGGLCIHFPYQNQLFDSANYCGLAFRSVTWHSFLSKFINSIGGGGGNQTTVAGTVTWPGHSLSNFCIAMLDSSHGSNIVIYQSVAVNPANGTFSMQLDLANPVEVYVEGWDDVNNNQALDTGDGIGWWDIDGNSAWDDMFTLNPGDAITNANVVLEAAYLDRPPKHITNR